MHKSQKANVLRTNKSNQPELKVTHLANKRSFTFKTEKLKGEVRCKASKRTEF